MKKSEKTAKPTHRRTDPNVMGLRADVVEQNITETLETNYMPYAMSVIVSRAIPEIDGFKPSHRKLLYTMYKMAEDIGIIANGKLMYQGELDQLHETDPSKSLEEIFLSLTGEESQ